MTASWRRAFVVVFGLGASMLVGCSPRSDAADLAQVVNSDSVNLADSLRREALAQIALEERRRAALGDFELHPSRDDMTGENRSAVGVGSQDENGRQWMLAWICEDGASRVAITSANPLGGNVNDDVEVLLRFDDAPAVDLRMWELTRSKTILFVTRDMNERFTALARPATRVRVRITDPSDGEQVNLSFNLTGLSTALRRLGNCR